MGLASIFGINVSKRRAAQAACIAAAGCVAAWLAPADVRHDIVRDIQDTFTNTGCSTVLQGITDVAGLVVTPTNPCVLYKPLKPGVVITMPDGIDHREPAAIVAVAAGVVNVSRMPTITSPTIMTELAALHDRHCAETKNQFTADLADLTKFVEDNWDSIFPFGITCEFEYDTWYPIWNNRFPANVRRGHDEAREFAAMWGRGGMPSHHNSSHVKSENTMQSDEFGTTHKTPRLIKAKKALSKVRTGPWMYWFAQQLKHNWNADHVVFYSDGSMPDAIGKWATRVAARVQHFRKGDYGRFDTTQRHPLLQLRAYVYDHVPFRRPQDVATEMDYKKQTQVTRAGIKVTGPVDQESGRDDTSSGNSLGDGLYELYDTCTTHGLTVAQLRQIAHWIMVKGDDSVVAALSQYVEPNIPLRATLGLDLEFEVFRDITECETCSAVFWAVDPNNPLGTHYVLAPKPGRILARSGWLRSPAAVNGRKNGTLSIRDLRELKGNLRGIAYNTHFIPPISAVIARTLVLVQKRLDAAASARPGLDISPIVDPDVAHKPTLTQIYRPTEATIQQIYTRYGTDWQELNDFLITVANIESLPVDVQTPFTAKVIARDV
jgi:hypothetical protein